MSPCARVPTSPSGLLGAAVEELTALCVVRSRRGTGTGFAFFRPGWIVTAKHVVAGQPPAEPLRLVFRQGISLPARVLFAHPRVDLAVLEVLGGSPCLTPFLPGGQATVEGDLLCVGLESSVVGEEAGSAPFVVRVESYERSVRQRDGHEEVLYIFPAPDREQLRSGGPLVAPGGGVIGVVVDGITLGGQRMMRATSIGALLDELGGNGGKPATDVNDER